MSEWRDHPARPPELTSDAVTQVFFFFFLLFYRLASRAFVPCTATMEQVKEKGSELTVQGVFKGKTPNGELHALVLLDWAGG